MRALARAAAPILLLAAACSPADPAAGPARSPRQSAPASPTGPPPSTGGTGGTGGGSTPTVAESTRPVPAGGRSGSPAATPAGTPKDLCAHRSYRCTSFAGARAWWAGKPLLYDPRDARDFLLHSLEPGAPDSASSGDQPNVTTTFPSGAFTALRRGDVHAAVETKAVVVRVYFAPATAAPAPNPIYRELTVRGHRAYAVDYLDEGKRRRSVSWAVPGSDGAVVVFRVEDSPADRSDADLVAFLNGLAET